MDIEPAAAHPQRHHAKAETVVWLLWYNRNRRHSTMGYVSPMQFEQT
ncbi:MAG: transposase [Polaromonas sp.]|nr:IS3 family transposase [Polaromonas sp.]NDP63639.1 transposase [Polaromonas sp.]